MMMYALAILGVVAALGIFLAARAILGRIEKDERD